MNRLKAILLCGILLSGCAERPIWVIYDERNTPLNTGFIRQITLEKGRLAWVGTYGDGLYRVVNGKWIKVGAPYEGDYVLCLKEKDGVLWIGTARKGAYSYMNGRFLRQDSTSGLCGNNVWDICFGPKDEMLFCSRYNGITRTMKGQFSCLNRDSGLPDNEVTVAQYDARGCLWIGTARAGLCGIRKQDTIMLHRGNGLSGNYIRALICDTVPRYVGSWDGGLDFYNERGWEHQAAVGKPVVILNQDAEGRIWAGTWGMGVFINNRGVWSTLNSGNSGLPDNHVIDIKFGANGMVYLATNKGVACFPYP